MVGKYITASKISQRSLICSKFYVKILKNVGENRRENQYLSFLDWSLRAWDIFVTVMECFVIKGDFQIHVLTAAILSNCYNWTRQELCNKQQWQWVISKHNYNLSNTGIIPHIHLINFDPHYLMKYLKINETNELCSLYKPRI